MNASCMTNPTPSRESEIPRKGGSKQKPLWACTPTTMWLWGCVLPAQRSCHESCHHRVTYAWGDQRHDIVGHNYCISHFFSRDFDSIKIHHKRGAQHTRRFESKFNLFRDHCPLRASPPKTLSSKSAGDTAAPQKDPQCTSTCSRTPRPTQHRNQPPPRWQQAQPAPLVQNL